MFEMFPSICINWKTFRSTLRHARNVFSALAHCCTAVLISTLDRACAWTARQNPTKATALPITRGLHAQEFIMMGAPLQHRVLTPMATPPFRTRPYSDACLQIHLCCTPSGRYAASVCAIAKITKGTRFPRQKQVGKNCLAEACRILRVEK